jgi:hypothetical protein
MTAGSGIEARIEKVTPERETMGTFVSDEPETIGSSEERRYCRSPGKSSPNAAEMTIRFKYQTPKVSELLDGVMEVDPDSSSTVLLIDFSTHGVTPTSHTQAEITPE